MPKGSRVPGQTSVPSPFHLFASVSFTLWLRCQTRNVKCAAQIQNAGLVLKINVAYSSPQESTDSIIPFLFIEKENSNIIIFRSRRDFSPLYYSNIKYKSKKEQIIKRKCNGLIPLIFCFTHILT